MKPAQHLQAGDTVDMLAAARKCAQSGQLPTHSLYGQLADTQLKCASCPHQWLKTCAA